MKRIKDLETDIDLWSVTQVACRLGISKPRCYELIRKQLLPHTRFGSRVVVPRAAYMLWLQKQTEEALESVKTGYEL